MMRHFVHQKPIIRTQIMGSYYFFSENFLQQNYAYKFKKFIKSRIVDFRETNELLEDTLSENEEETENEQIYD